MNRYITHTKKFHDIRQPLSDFFEICGVLGHKLGPFLIGLAPSFKKDLDRLEEILSLLPDHRFAFEFRHYSWFSNEVFERVSENRNLTLVVLGAQFNKIDRLSNFAYIRWHARGGDHDIYSSEELDYWARQIQCVSNKADVFGYWNHSVDGPKNCLDLASRLDLR